MPIDRPGEPHWKCPDCGFVCECSTPQQDHPPCGVPTSGWGDKGVSTVYGRTKPPPPESLWDYIIRRDDGCVAPRLGLGVERACFGRVEVDHVRASGALGKKSPSTADNLVSLCGQHHYLKTMNGRTWRPRLIEYINEKEGIRDPDERA